MTEAQRLAAAASARTALEVVGPIFGELRSAYAERMVELANSELSRDKRADKLTALSNALRIVDQLEKGIGAIIVDGDIAERERIKAQKIENMTAPQRRLLNIGGY
jgi:hypothetical protein